MLRLHFYRALHCFVHVSAAVCITPPRIVRNLRHLLHFHCTLLGRTFTVLSSCRQHRLRCEHAWSAAILAISAMEVDMRALAVLRNRSFPYYVHFCIYNSGDTIRILLIRHAVRTLPLKFLLACARFRSRTFRSLLCHFHAACLTISRYMSSPGDICAAFIAFIRRNPAGAVGLRRTNNISVFKYRFAAQGIVQTNKLRRFYEHRAEHFCRRCFKTCVTCACTAGGGFHGDDMRGISHFWNR